jgi:hypothetical protein
MNLILVLQKLPDEKLTEDNFYVIEKFPYPQFVTDENGEAKCFSTYKDAFAEASDCQQGYVVSFSG